jgi:hypothetical protein
VNERPSRVRIAVATLIVVLFVIGVAKFIDWRMRPPPPPPQSAAHD